MKVRVLRALLDELVKKNPKVDNFTVVYSIDDEGNDYKKVLFEPTTGQLTTDRHGISSFDNQTTSKHNALCVN